MPCLPVYITDVRECDLINGKEPTFVHCNATLTTQGCYFSQPPEISTRSQGSDKHSRSSKSEHHSSSGSHSSKSKGPPGVQDSQIICHQKRAKPGGALQARGVLAPRGGPVLAAVPQGWAGQPQTPHPSVPASPLLNTPGGITLSLDGVPGSQLLCRHCKAHAAPQLPLLLCAGCRMVRYCCRCVVVGVRMRVGGQCN
jgi:hypothetical protein